jgi:hypothetical protein
MIVCAKCGLRKSDEHYTMHEPNQEPICDACCRIIRYHAVWAIDRPLVLKQCRVCGLEKPLDAFYAKPDAKDGRRGECRQCFKAHSNAPRLKTAVRANTQTEAVQ